MILRLIVDRRPYQPNVAGAGDTGPYQIWAGDGFGDGAFHGNRKGAEANFYITGYGTSRFSEGADRAAPLTDPWWY
jgi:hypothetical protein